MNYRDVLCSVIPDYCQKGAEIGVHKGSTSRVLLERFPDLKLYMVDPWSEWVSSIDVHTPETQAEAKQMAHDAVREFGDRAVILEATSSDAAQTIPAGLDFVFVDAEHDYESVLADLEAWHPKTSLLICHDYDQPQWPGVTEAVNDFASQIGLIVHAEEKNIAWLS